MESEQVSPGLGECLARLDTLTNIVLAQSKKIDKISKRLKDVNIVTDDNKNMLVEIDCKLDDVQNSMEDCQHDVESLKSKNRVTHSILRKLAQGLNLPTDQFLSDVENNKIRKLHAFGGSRENIRRRNKHRQDRYREETVHEKSCDSVDSDSSDDTDNDRYSTHSSATQRSTTPQVPGMLAPSGQRVPGDVSTTRIISPQMASESMMDDISNLQRNRYQHEADKMPVHAMPSNIQSTHPSSFIDEPSENNILTTEPRQNVPPQGNHGGSNRQQRPPPTQHQESPSLPVTLNSREPSLSSVSVQHSSGAKSLPSSFTTQINFETAEKFMESLSLPVNEETKQAISRAFNADSDRTMERPSGLYTIILLDTSASIQAPAKAQIKDFISNLIDEIEESAATDHLEENVALVTFGGRTGIEREFNNDYSIILDAYESLESVGRSPMLTGLAVCLAYLHRIAKNVKFDTKREPSQKAVEIFPRIVMITDGQITDDHTFKGQDVDTNPIRAKSKLMQFMQMFSTQGYPLYCVGVGESFDKMILAEMVKGSHGKVMMHDSEDASLLGQYYFLQTIACKVVQEYRENGGHGDPQEAFRRVLSPYIERLEKNKNAGKEIEEILRDYDMKVNYSNLQEAIVDSVTYGRELQEESQELHDESDDTEVDKYGCTEYGRLPVIGTRVKRGPHWNRGNEDHKGHGTVVAHATEEAVVVKWDNNILNQYHYTGSRQEITNVSVPRLVLDLYTIHVGCWVKRGKDWSRGDEDGGAEHGVVIRKHRDKTVTVRWPIGFSERYKFGKDDIYEIEVLGAKAGMVEDIPSDTEYQTPLLGGGTEKPLSVGGGAGISLSVGGGTGMEESIAAWQFQDENSQWRTLSIENSAMVESYANSQKPGTVLIHHKGVQMRVDPKKLRYSQSGSTSGAVKRTMMSPEEFQTIMSVEDII